MYTKEALVRIGKDSEGVAAKFPQFRMYKAQGDVFVNNWKVASDGLFYFIGKLRTVSNNVYTVVINIPSDFPFGELKAFVTDPVIGSTEHRYSDGHLCLYGHEGKGDLYQGGRTSVATVIAWTAAWLHAHESWKKKGVWPMISL